MTYVDLPDAITHALFQSAHDNNEYVIRSQLAWEFVEHKVVKGRTFNEKRKRADDLARRTIARFNRAGLLRQIGKGWCLK